MTDKVSLGVGVAAAQYCGVQPTVKHSDLSGVTAVPEYFARILKNKDRIIRSQAKRIECLESEVERLRVARETLSSQLAVLSYKLELSSRANIHVVEHNQIQSSACPAVALDEKVSIAK